MATEGGYIVKMPDGSTQKIPDSQAATSPYINPNQLKQWTQGITLPGQAVESGQIGIQQQQAQLPGQTAQSNVAVATQQPKIQTANSDAIIANQRAEAAQFIKDVTNNFAKAKKDNNGVVPPQYYNEVKGESGQFGIDSAGFDGAFHDSNVDTKHEINYDTAAGASDRQLYNQTKLGLQSQIEGYNSIPADQKGLFSKSIFTNIPGPLKQVLAPQAAEYIDQLSGLSTKLGGIAGTDKGTGSLRITQTELNNWSTLMPSPTKTNAQNAYDITQLNRLLESKFGKGNGLDPQYKSMFSKNSSIQSPQPTSQGVWQ